MLAAQIQLLQETLKKSWLKRSWLSWLLWPLSMVLGVWVLFRRWLYRCGLIRSYRVDVPVIVVGNVVAGGAGKTPVVMAIVSHLLRRGFKPGVISRGYGRQTANCREVFMNSSAADVGDEPALIKRNLSVPVFVASHRVEAAQGLLKAYANTNVIVCDDGLQHLALHRDIEICVFDDRGPGNGFLLPAGPLREPWPRNVDLIIHTGDHPAFPGFGARRKLQSQATRMDGTTIHLSELCASDGPPILAVAGIAQPENFFGMLRALGLQLSGSVALPDHFDFTQWQRPRDRDYCLVCTEKDAVKLWAHHPDALSFRLDCELDAAFLHELDERLEQARRAQLSSDHGHTTS